MSKVPVEVHDKRDLQKKKVRLQKKVQRLQETRIRILQQGGRGWVFEIASTNMEIAKAMNEITRLFSLLYGR